MHQIAKAVKKIMKNLISEKNHMLQCHQSPSLQVEVKATIQASDEQQFHHPEVLKSGTILLTMSSIFK